MPEAIDVIDSIRLNFSPNSLLFMNITLAFVMFGVALEIKVEHFKNILKKPKPAIVGFISQFFLLPAMTFLLLLIIKPSPSIALGMILVAACPGGNISNFISLLAKGNASLSVSLTAIATLTAIFLTPLNFALWGGMYSAASQLILPVKIDPLIMLKTVIILLGIPLITGLLFASKFPNTTKKITKPIKIFSIIIFLGFVSVALIANFNHFLKYIHLIVLLVLAHNALAFLSGFGISKLFKLSEINTRSVTIETGIQNSGLALILIFNPKLFNGMGGMAFIAAWWGIWHIIAGLSLAAIWSKKSIR